MVLTLEMVHLLFYYQLGKCIYLLKHHDEGSLESTHCKAQREEPETAMGRCFDERLTQALLPGVSGRPGRQPGGQRNNQQ